MLRLSFLRSLRTLLTTPRSPCPRPRPVPPAARRLLRCEQLEDRAVPAGLVSSFASAVSFASPVNVAGTSDLVTIAVEDALGNPISGLTSSDFAFSLSSLPRPPRIVPPITILPFPFDPPVIIDDPSFVTTPDIVTTFPIFNPPIIIDDPSFITTPSSGTFGQVLEIGTSGTYFTQFTGATAGAPVRLTVSVGGTTLISRPNVQVTTGAVSASNSTVSVAPSSQSEVAVVTIGAVDAAGNAITGLPNSAFQFGLTGGTTTGTFGPVTETGTPGVYTTTLTGRVFVGFGGNQATTLGGLFLDQGGSLGSGLVVSSGSLRFPSQGGTPSTLAVTVDGTQLNSQPVVKFTREGYETVNVDPPDTGIPPILIAQLAPEVILASSTAASGMTNLVTIVVRRTDGSPVLGLKNDDFTLKLLPSATLQSSNQPLSTGAVGQVIETATPGTYTTQFTGRTAGAPLTLTVDINGVLSVDRPTIQVTPGAVSASDSTVSVAPSVRREGVVAISLKDAARNAVTGLPGTAFRLELSGGTSAGTFGSMTERGTSGVYAATFTGRTVGTPSALTATIDGAPLNSRPAVEVTEAVPLPPEPPASPAAVVALPPAPAAVAPAAPLYTGAFMVGNVLVLQGAGVPGGVAVVPLPAGVIALFMDANGDGSRDVVLFLPRLAVVLDGVTGRVVTIPF